MFRDHELLAYAPLLLVGETVLLFPQGTKTLRVTDDIIVLEHGVILLPEPEVVDEHHQMVPQARDQLQGALQPEPAVNQRTIQRLHAQPVDGINISGHG